MNYLKLFAIAAFLLPAQSYALDSSYSFRGIQLGDNIPQAETKARQQFDHAELENMFTDSVTVKAGDMEGFKLMRTTCPIAAPFHLRPNCLRATFSTGRDGEIDKVQFIRATQSFNSAIPLDLFLARLNDTYGTPRASYKNNQNKFEQAVTERTLLWGGSKTPSDYSQSSIPWDDIALIGGKFISIQINISGTEVIGYELRIVDAEKIQKAKEEARTQHSFDAENAKKKVLIV
jgi:hypothetical protein